MSYYDHQIQKASGSSTQEPSRSKAIHYGLVTELLDAHRIRVRIQGIDTKIQTNKLPICYALIPLHLHFLPKVGEVVRVILSDASNPFDDRLWVGPVITDYDYLNQQAYPFGQEVTLTEQAIADLTTPVPRNSFPNSAGVFPDAIPNADEQKLLGRGNTEIGLDLRTAYLKAGKHTKDDIHKRNAVNQGTIQTNISQDGTKSSALILADMLLLLSHQGTPRPSSLHGQEFTDSDIDAAFAQAHPLPYADILRSFCELVRNAINEHVHPYDGKSPIKGDAMRKLNEFDLDSFISKNVKIN